ncbi:MAG: carbonic anhydrase family protein [Azoarcus sp.]|jgi:carbonic anhydrase|nr:carbonic anhydrase family protein [Azoarcus sp.]
MHTPARAFALLAAFALLSPVRAAEWEKIVADNGRTVEFDPAAIFNSDHGTKVAWGRIVLGENEAKQAGYRVIKALNRYDCLNRSFLTVKRVYLDGDANMVREETVADQAPMLVRHNSVDERIWRKICGLTPDERTPPARARASHRGTTAEKIDRIAAAADRAAKAVHAASLDAREVNAEIARPTPAVAISPPPPRAGLLRVAEGNVAAPPEQAPPPAKTETAPTSATPLATQPALTPIPAPVQTIAPVPPPPTRIDTTPAAQPMPRQATAITLPPPISVSAPASTPASIPAPNTLPFTRPSITPAAARSPRAPERSAYPSRNDPSPLIFPARATQREAARMPPPSRASTPPLRASSPSPDDGTDWSYYGAQGPDFWGRLRPEWKLCAEGKRQSPIDFVSSAPVKVDLEPVKFDYRRTRVLIAHGERELRVKVLEPMGIEVRGRRYRLEGFTLHRPGESRFDGRASDMEAHFLHRDGDGKVAILAVQLARGDTPNELLQTLLNNLPLEKGSAYTPDVTIELAAFPPKTLSHFLYMGSLSMPPCTEDTLWVVMKEPVTISEEQLNIFSRLHEANARPAQPANGRLVLESR